MKNVADPTTDGRLGLTPQRRAVIGGLAALAWAATRAGIDGEVVNSNGWPSFARFWGAVTSPELAAEFLMLTIDAAGTTLAFAVLGTGLSLVIGAAGALLLSELLNGGGLLWRLSRLLAAIPRATHEILWAILLTQILGFDPLVAVLAIGIPFGAVSAKVFAETIDEADPGPYTALRATGAHRLTALAYGLLPTLRGQLTSYSFYRFECAIRSAAVLGVIGAGGLGFQLDLSFETLRYGEIWTLIVALMILSGLADGWSSTVRRATNPVVQRASLLVIVAAVPLAWGWVGIDVSRLWAARSRGLAADLAGRMLPPQLGPEGWGGLVEAALDTVAMSILALVIAAVGGFVVALVVSRPRRRSGRGLAGATARSGSRLLLLLCRAVPAPIWAFLFVLILFPGAWPGAIGLAVYNLGVLGRLFAEAIEESDAAPGDALARIGASPLTVFGYGTLPTVAPRLIALSLYRWETIVRETVVVGVVGAGGLGQLVNNHLAARDFAAVLSAIAALVVVSIGIDTISAALRRSLR